MLNVPSFNRCVGFAKESALFVHDERPEQISVDITEEDEDSFDVDDNDEGFEDEDYEWLLCLKNWHLSDQVYI